MGGVTSIAWMAIERRPVVTSTAPPSGVVGTGDPSSHFSYNAHTSSHLTAGFN
jgi:hypothetical protein